jgi:hypothetical protein
MAVPTCISDYLRRYGSALGEVVLARFPSLHSPDDIVWPALKQMKRHPFPAQAMAIMGIVKRWQEAGCAAAAVTFSVMWPKRPRYGLTGCGQFMV